MKRIVPAGWIGFGLLFALCASPSGAQVILKPKGHNAFPLRQKEVRADIVIDRQLVATNLTLTFQNELSERIEADFIYTLPPHTLVTYFAYWYGTEKVVARVVEKERAAAIYKNITTRMRDPALIEMVGKDTFRARIFPVMPNADLKVEMHFAQALSSDKNGASFRLPLKTPPDVKLNVVAVNVQVKNDPPLLKITNNYGLPMIREAGETRFTLAGMNYRPINDVRIGLIRKPQPLHAALYAAPSGGKDGFFALALTPDSALKRPAVTINGVSVYQVVPGRLAAVGAYESLIVCGRYKGSGEATVTLTGDAAGGIKTYTQTVVFGKTPDPNNPAALLWASKRMEELSAGGGNRVLVIAMSKRFNLPGEYTSWLALPAEERDRYKQEWQEAELRAAGERLAQEIIQGREQSREAREARARLVTLGRSRGWSPEQSVQGYLPRTIYPLAREYVNERSRPTPNHKRLVRLHMQLGRLAKATGTNRDTEILSMEYPYISREIEYIQGMVIEERHSKKPHPQRIAELEDEFIVLHRLVYRNNFTNKDEEAYLKARQKRIAVRTEREHLDSLMADTSRLTREILADMVKRRNELYWADHELRGRRGDPLIKVEAPADARQVIAILPSGEIRPLAYSADNRRWEAHFDIPGYAQEGDYLITILIVLNDGTRQMLTMRYHVDTTAPTGTGKASLNANATLRLEIDAAEDTARVKALLPWGEAVELSPSTQEPHRFFALVPVPAAGQGKSPSITFILTDRAHNRTTLRVGLSPK